MLKPSRTPFIFIVIYLCSGIIVPVGIDFFFISPEFSFWKSPQFELIEILAVIVIVCAIALTSLLFDSKKTLRLIRLFKFPGVFGGALINIILYLFLVTIFVMVFLGVDFSKIRHSGSLSEGGFTSLLYAFLLPCVRFILIFQLVSKLTNLASFKLSKITIYLLLLSMIFSISSMRSAFDILLCLLVLSGNPKIYFKKRLLFIGIIIVISTGFLYKFGNFAQAASYLSSIDYIKKVASVRTTSGIHSLSAAVQNDFKGEFDSSVLGVATSIYRLDRLLGLEAVRPEKTINRANFEAIVDDSEILPNAGASPGFLAGIIQLGPVYSPFVVLLVLFTLSILSVGNVNVVASLFLYYGAGLLLFENPANLIVFPSEIHLLMFIAYIYGSRFCVSGSGRIVNEN
ncbi:hypothetical protein N8214_03430 [Pseudomonadales bacterium]|nr:hypothetical protein [Pseudomonadales bacterium]